MCFFGTDQILVRRRYGYKLRRGSLENLYEQWSGSEQGYIVYLTTHLLPVNNNNLSLHHFLVETAILSLRLRLFYQEKSYKKLTNLATSG